MTLIHGPPGSHQYHIFPIYDNEIVDLSGSLSFTLGPEFNNPALWGPGWWFHVIARELDGGWIDQDTAPGNQTGQTWEVVNPLSIIDNQYDENGNQQDVYNIELWSERDGYLFDIAQYIPSDSGSNSFGYQWTIHPSFQEQFNLHSDPKFYFKIKNPWTGVESDTNLFTIVHPASASNRNIRIDLIRVTGESVYNIAENTTNDGTYEFLVPEDGDISSDNYKIKVTATKPNGDTLESLTGLFSLRAGNVSLRDLATFSSLPDYINISNVNDKLRLSGSKSEETILYQYINRNFFGVETTYLDSHVGFYADKATPRTFPVVFDTAHTSGNLFNAGGGNGFALNGDYAYYKISAVYDGIQEGPLSEEYISGQNGVSDSSGNNTARAEFEFRFNLSNFSPRITHLNIYRALSKNAITKDLVYYYIDTIDTRRDHGTSGTTWAQQKPGKMFSGNLNNWSDFDSVNHTLLIQKGLWSYGYDMNSGAFTTIDADEHKMHYDGHADSVTEYIVQDKIDDTHANSIELDTNQTLDDWNVERRWHIFKAVEPANSDCDGPLVLADTGSTYNNTSHGNCKNANRTETDTLSTPATNGQTGLTKYDSNSRVSEWYDGNGVLGDADDAWLQYITSPYDGDVNVDYLSNGVSCQRNLKPGTYFLSVKFRLIPQYYTCSSNTWTTTYSNKYVDRIRGSFEGHFMLGEIRGSTNFAIAEEMKPILKWQIKDRADHDNTITLSTQITVTEQDNYLIWFGYKGNLDNRTEHCPDTTRRKVRIGLKLKNFSLHKSQSTGTNSFIGPSLVEVTGKNYADNELQGVVLKHEADMDNNGSVDSTAYHEVYNSMGNLVRLDPNQAQADADSVHTYTMEAKGWTSPSAGVIQGEYTDYGLGDKYPHPYEGQIIKTNYTYSKYMAGRLFVAGVRLNPDDPRPEDRDDWIMFSEVNKPDIIPVTNYIPLEDHEGGKIYGLQELNGDLVAFMSNGIFRLDVPATDPSRWSLVEAERNIGCTAPRSICWSEGGLFFAGKDNFYLLNTSFGLTPLMSSIRSDYLKYNDSETHAIYNERRQELDVVLGKRKEYIYSLDLQKLGSNQVHWSVIKLGGINKYSDSQVTDYISMKSDIMARDENQNRFVITHKNNESYIFQLHPDPPERDDIFNANVTGDFSGAKTLVDKSREILNVKRSTGWISLTSLEDTTSIRRVRVLYKTVDNLKIQMFADGNDALPVWEKTFLPTDTLIENDFYYSIIAPLDLKKTRFNRVGIRATHLKFKYFTNASRNPFEIKRIEVEVD
ncbi:MAG: hypothetical protein Unbinned5336contig1001_22 [Prokaryotic dsDNA virus sp.]|nr:MAG: hypothetical protein Unbinned5336contig1001_22 [Prokaryotic dsDNA virus sp.]